MDFSLLPLIIQYAGSIKGIIDIALNNEDLIEKFQKLVPALAPLVKSLGSALFPKVSDELTLAAGIMAAFDPNITRWIQGGLNVLLKDEEGFEELEVDGIYGPLTRGAVEQFQEKMGLDADGWAGRLTQAALDKALGDQQEAAGISRR